jgi:hypothetical protein
LHAGDINGYYVFIPILLRVIHIVITCINGIIFNLGITEFLLIPGVLRLRRLLLFLRWRG